MAGLPAAYAWLEKIEPPRIIVEALALYGIKEVPGPVNAPEIMAWARETGLQDSYVADAVPWCGLFAAVVVKRAGWESVAAPLWARNWARFGKPSPEPGLGDVLVFQRESGGHVGFYVGEDPDAYHVLGGNQGDSVSIIRVSKRRLIAARRPAWRIAQPASVKAYHLGMIGELSRNEA
jgi:uncharacterized protein (TIGR02594 family)